MPKVKPEPLAPEEAIAFWKDKVPLAPGKFFQLADEAKSKAFAVSGIARQDELSTVFSAIQRAIEDGTTYQDFVQDAAEVFERRGFKGWRVDMIFRTNVQTAYSVGRYKQQKETIALQPYWQLDIVYDNKTSPICLGLGEAIYPADHPFWDTWYPPNHFGERTSVNSLSENQVKEQGLKVATEDPTGGLIEPIDPKTGQKMPARPLLPTPGFEFNPGKAQWGGIKADEKPGNWKPLPKLKKAADYKRKALKNVSPKNIKDLTEGMFLPNGQPDQFYIDAFKKLYGEEKIIEDAAGEPVVLTLRSFLIDKAQGAKIHWKFAKPGHGEIIPQLAEMIEKPYEIWLTPQKNKDGRIRLAKRYISIWKTQDKQKIGGMSVFEVVSGKFQGVTAFAPFKGGMPALDYLEKQRQGLLLFKTGR